MMRWARMQVHLHCLSTLPQPLLHTHRAAEMAPAHQQRLQHATATPCPTWVYPAKGSMRKPPINRHCNSTAYQLAIQVTNTCCVTTLRMQPEALHCTVCGAPAAPLSDLIAMQICMATARMLWIDCARLAHKNRHQTYPIIITRSVSQMLPDTAMPRGELWRLGVGRYDTARSLRKVV